MNSPVLDQSYRTLPSILYSEVSVAPALPVECVVINEGLAQAIGLNIEWLKGADAVQFFAGQLSSGCESPIALAYSGHQFGGFSPQLGDGRAMLLGEYTADDGTVYDFHLKGSGQTSYSRRGDGKSTLRAALKEYLFSESLAALGIPTTRSLAVVVTGEKVFREDVHPGAILTRVARSHVRVGTFQFAALQGDETVLKALADFVIARDFSQINIDDEDCYFQLFKAILSRQAKLVALWMSHGFIHGVMNTDNMAISGETLDFGPCAFMDTFKSNQHFSSIDEQGRYAWDQQADIAVWNLTRLAEAMLPLFSDDKDQGVEMAKAALNEFAVQFNEYFNTQLGKKLGFEGLDETLNEKVIKLLSELLPLLHHNSVDFTLFFRYLSDIPGTGKEERLRSLFKKPEAVDQWLEKYQQILPSDEAQRGAMAERMNGVNPLYIPRTYLVEEALANAKEGDMALFNRLLEAIQSPYSENSDFTDLALPPPEALSFIPTFCET